MEKLSLITGVSRQMGLGYETAKQLVSLCHTVIITARDIAKVKPLANDANLIARSLDVTSETSINNLAEEVEKDPNPFANPSFLFREKYFTVDYYP